MSPTKKIAVPFSVSELLLFHNFFMPPPFSMGRVYSITAVRTYVRPILSVPSVPYVTQMVSVQYLLKKLVYWIEILYTGIYNHKM